MQTNPGATAELGGLYSVRISTVHVLATTLNYRVMMHTILQNASARSYKGDFYVGVIMTMDFSNLFANSSKVYKMVSLILDSHHFLLVW